MKITRTVFALTLAALAVLSGCESAKAGVGSEPVVSTQAGKIRGSVTKSGVLSFKGVPYAEASERFVPAKPVAKWKGVRDATEYGKISPQMEFMSTNMVSDEISDNNCQNLNIWTPGLDKKKRAVMVWLHGGGFSSGNAQETPAYDGENLAQAGDVVVVSVNHRLNILGFFDLSKYGEKYRYSGNAGVQDIIDSLTWIKSNIVNFGGDPNNVTVFGESGGGAKVLALISFSSKTFSQSFVNTFFAYSLLSEGTFAIIFSISAVLVFFSLNGSFVISFISNCVGLNFPILSLNLISNFFELYSSSSISSLFLLSSITNFDKTFVLVTFLENFGRIDASPRRDKNKDVNLCCPSRIAVFVLFTSIVDNS